MTNEELFQIACTSPALTEQHQSGDRFEYPANYRGRVPLKVRMAKNVVPDAPAMFASPKIIAKADQEYFVWVNKHGAVTAIMEDGQRLGLLPSEFDVTEWHKK